MKKTWKTFVVFAMLLALAALTAASAQAEGMTRIQLGTKESAEDGSWETTENGIRITKPGEYLISGTLEQGQILVDCTETGKVTLYLDGVTVHNAQGPAVRIGECSPRAVISLVDKSVNTLSNGTDLILDSGDEPDGVIYSRSDLTVTGNGSLEVRAGALNGIVSKDDLKIQGGDIRIQAPNHGIKGKDAVEISGGNIVVEAGRDGVKATNKNDADRGYIEITGGELTVSCGDDAISYVTFCSVTGGKIHLSSK